MNIDNLEIGLEVKNYKTMCELLEEEVKSGKSKQLQLEKWKQYFTWHKVGHKFIIDSIGKKLSPTNYGTSIEEKMNIVDFVGEKVTTFDKKETKPTNVEIVSTDVVTEKFWKTAYYDYYNLFYYRLPIGMQFNSVKEICEYLNIPYDKKNPNRTMKIIEKFYKFKKEGNKMEVIEVKDRFIEPLEKVDFRTDKQTAWTMGNVLLTLIYKYSYGEDRLWTFFSYGQLYKLAQMHNEHYNEYEYNRKELALETELEINVVNDFFNLCKGVFKANVKKGASNLNNRCLAFATEGYAICEKINVNGKIERIHRLATSEEIKIILEHERKALNYFGVRTKKEIWQLGKVNDFYKFVSNGIKQDQQYYNGDLMNMEYYYKCLKFISNYKDIEEEYFIELSQKFLKESKEQSTNKLTNAKKYKENEQDMKVLKDKLID